MSRNCSRPNVETLALCLGMAVACLESGVQPIWVDALIRDGRLSISGVGWLASTDLLLIAISALGISSSSVRMRPRSIAIAAASVFSLANAIAMSPASKAFIVGRLASGLATGALLACITGFIVRRRDVQRTLALTTGATLFLNSVVYLMLPLFSGQKGSSVLFAILAGLGVAAAITIALGAPNVRSSAAERTWIEGAPKVAPLLGCFALFSVAVGIGTIVTYLLTIGTGLGFAVGPVGKVLAAIGPLTILGPLAARILGERMGLLQPILMSLVVLGGDCFLLVNSGSLLLFGICAAVFCTAPMFYQPYGIVLISRVDPSGRFASAAQAFVALGAAAGAKLGSEVLGYPNFRAVAAVAAAWIAVSASLSALVAYLCSRTDSCMSASFGGTSGK